MGDVDFETVAIILLVYFLVGSVANGSFYMEDNCGMDIDMSERRIFAGRLKLTRKHKYSNAVKCTCSVKAPLGQRLTIVFRELGIEWESGCDDDYLQLFDGNSTKSPHLPGLASKICGNKEPSGSYVTAGRYLTLYFQSDVHAKADGFDIVFTAFSLGTCNQDEFRCKNGRCIDHSLQCNKYNNCGDNSDECSIAPTAILGIAAGTFLVTIVLLGVVLVVRKKRKLAAQLKKKQKQKVKTADDVIDASGIYRVPGSCALHSVDKPVLTTLSTPSGVSGGFAGKGFCLDCALENQGLEADPGCSYSQLHNGKPKMEDRRFSV